MYVKIDNGEYPVNESEIRTRHPEWCYPVPFEPCDGYAFVHPAAPPAHNPATQRVEETAPRRNGEVWVQCWRVVSLQEKEASGLLAMEQARLNAAVTARRWDVETSGITLPGGLRIETARADQDAITRVLVNAEAAGITEVRFKAASGWVELSLEQLRQIANAVALHVQACYDAEHAHHAAIHGLTTLAQALAYDIHGGWPA
ncbi:MULTISPECIES: DUF4376 domain-containing protein [Paracidovorax]|uniref:DUF4376 domain-containing protein n=1 Tax=Paracidovorax TaxID=3051137 RepID=UPI0009FC60B4|nr:MULTISPECIES: DUF4376 domain-containing protein [Paracidovorax]AVT13507.1 DUF4376 domain-containing protein [Paracidovorax avenae]